MASILTEGGPEKAISGMASAPDGRLKPGTVVPVVTGSPLDNYKYDLGLRLSEVTSINDLPHSDVTQVKAAIENALALEVPVSIPARLAPAGDWTIDERVALINKSRVDLSGTLVSKGTGSVTGAVLGLGQQSWGYLTEEWSTGTGGGKGYPGFFEGGKIRGISIANAGSGYTSAPAVSIAAPPSGVRATATATIDPVSGAVTAIAITNPGSGYKTPPAVTIAASPKNDNAEATAVVGSVFRLAALSKWRLDLDEVAPTGSKVGRGSVVVASNGANGFVLWVATKVENNVRVDFGGSGYSALPTPNVTVSPPDEVDGVTAEAEAVVVGNSVTAINVTNPGSGYRSAPTITIQAPPSGTVNRAKATAFLTEEGAGQVTVYRAFGAFDDTGITLDMIDGVAIAPGNEPEISSPIQDGGKAYDAQFLDLATDNQPWFFVADRGYKTEIGATIPDTRPYGSGGAQLMSECVDTVVLAGKSDDPSVAWFKEESRAGVDCDDCWLLYFNSVAGFYPGATVVGQTSDAEGVIAAVLPDPINALVVHSATWDFVKEAIEIKNTEFSVAATSAVKMPQFEYGFLVKANNPAVYESGDDRYTQNLLQDAVIDGSGALVSEDFSPFQKSGAQRLAMRIASQSGQYGAGSNLFLQSFVAVDFPRPYDKLWDIAMHNSWTTYEFVEMRPAETSQGDLQPGNFNEYSWGVTIRGQRIDVRGRTFIDSVMTATSGGHCLVDVGSLDYSQGSAVQKIIGIGDSVAVYNGWNGGRRSNRRTEFRLNHIDFTGTPAERVVQFDTVIEQTMQADCSVHVGYADGVPLVAAVDIRHRVIYGPGEDDHTSLVPARVVVRPRITGCFRNGDVFLDGAIDPYVDVALENGRVAGIPDNCFVLENGVRKFAGAAYKPADATPSPTLVPNAFEGQLDEGNYETRYVLVGGGTAEIEDAINPTDGQVLTINIRSAHFEKTLTATGAITVGETVRVGSYYYKFADGNLSPEDGNKPNGSSTKPWRVQIGANATASLVTLAKAIDQSGVDDEDYSSQLLQNVAAKTAGVTATTLTIVPRVAGPLSITTQVTAAFLTWTQSSLSVTPQWNPAYTGAPGTTTIDPGKRSIFCFKRVGDVWLLLWQLQNQELDGALLWSHDFASDRYINKASMVYTSFREGGLVYNEDEEPDIESEILSAAIPGLRPGGAYEVRVATEGQSQGSLVVALGKSDHTTFPSTASPSAVERYLEAGEEVPTSNVGMSLQSVIRFGFLASVNPGTKLRTIEVREI